MKRLAIILLLLLSPPAWAQFPPQGVLLPQGSGGGGGGGGGSGTVFLGNPGNIAYYPGAATQVGPATGTAHGVFLYEAPNAPTTTGVGTTGQVLTGISASDPIWATPNGDISETSVSGGNISFTVQRVNGAIPGGSCAGATPFVTSLNSQAIPTCMPSTTSPSFRSFTLLGATSGSDAIGVPAIAGTGTVFNFPANNGTNGYALTTDGSGNTSWTSIAGSGTVTQLNPGAGVALTPNPITGVGTVALAVPVAPANGGTGVISPTAHAVMVGEGSSAMTALACGANAILTGVASSDPACTVTPQLGVVGTSTGTLGLAGSTSGVVTIQPQASTGSYNFNLPTSAGTSGKPLLSGGGGSTAQTYGTLTVGGGGTGITSGSSGGVPYFSSSSTMVSSGTLTANQPVIGGGSGSAPTVGSKSGNTNVFGTTSGTLTNGDCAQFDASGNIVDSGGACGGGGGGGPNTTPTIISGTTAGTATCYTPWQSVSLGEVRCKLVGYENTTATPQTYTYQGGYTFGIAPVFDQNIVPLASASTTTLSFPANMLAPVTGYIVLVGTQ